MKKLLYSLLFLGTIVLSSCEDFTDLQPKGKNLLSTTTELEMLLNQEMYFRGQDMRHVANDVVYCFDNLQTLFGRPQKTRQSIVLSIDDAEMDLMAELTPSDDDYSGWYQCIGAVANPILMQVDAASGDENMKKQLKAEALTIRAYFHWLLVNKFAKAYNPSTAENDPGIPYVTHEWDITVPTERVTVQKVYENILTDINEAIALDALPVVNVNKMRMNKAAAYAVKALALMSMQNFTEAAKAAQDAVDISGEIMDYTATSKYATGMMIGGQYPVIYREPLKCVEDYFYTHYIEFYNHVTTEAWEYFEEGHASKDKMSTADMLYDYLMNFAQDGMGLGVPYITVYDMDSGWNQVGIKSTYMYLLLAECAIHNNQIDVAMGHLDKIREKRIDPSVYAPLKGTITSEADAIEYLKKTSHGEGIYSIYNFLQKKRWNELANFKQSWSKRIGEKDYAIKPGSPLWVFPFPMNAVNNNPNLLPQNYESVK